MPKVQTDMIRGTLAMLILRVVSLEPMHGWGISERIQQMSDDALQVNQGSLYASLHRLTRQGWIKSEWRVTENNRRARYYILTRAGEQQLRTERDQWARLSGAVEQIMGTA
jgi:PadR family transcriptional regulator PadR